MAYDAFLKIDGIEGETTRRDHKGEIEILSFSWGVSNPATIGAGGGGGSGKASVSSFNVMRVTDKASPLLFQACCTGLHIPKAEARFYKAGGDEAVPYLLYEFEKVFIESVQWSGSSGGDDRPTESLTLAFGKVQVTYTPQTDTGAKGSAVVGSWNLMEVSK
jgi:type VI secretion system secreted protein Hcp